MLRVDVVLYVGNLARSVSENELRSLFSEVGEVTAIRLIKNRINGESEEYGFVSMSCQSEADHAVSRFNRYLLSEQTLRVGLVKPRGRSSRPGPLLEP